MRKKQTTSYRMEIISSDPDTGLKFSRVVTIVGIIVAVVFVVAGFIASGNVRGDFITLAIIAGGVLVGAIAFINFHTITLIIRLLVDIKLELRKMNGKDNEVLNYDA